MDRKTVDSVQYTSVRCNRQNLTEWEFGRPVFIIPLIEIKRITLRHGILAPHPILLSTFGIILTVLGLVPVIHFLYVAANGGHFFHLEASMCAMSFIGVWALFTAFRKGYYLDVETNHGHSRLRFHPDPSPTLIKEFLSDLTRRFGLDSEVHL